MQIIPLLVEEILASREGLCSMELARVERVCDYYTTSSQDKFYDVSAKY